MVESLEEKRKTSPMYSFRPTLTANGVWTLELDQGEYKKYVPFNMLRITNNSGSTLKAIVNGTREFLVHAGTVIALDGTVIPGLWNVAIYEMSGTATNNNEIEVIVQKTVTMDNLALNIAKRYKLW